MRTKKVIKNLIPMTLLLLLLLSNGYAAVVNLDSYWDGDENTLAAAFTAAANAAGNGGTIALSEKTYLSNKTIFIKKSVTINGAGKWKTTIKLTETNNIFFYVQSDNVTFQNLTINSNGKSLNSIKTGINSQPPGGKNLSCKNICVINHKDVGIFGGKAIVLNGLYLENCDFASDIPNAYPHVFICNRHWNIHPVYSIDPFTIKNCTFSGVGGGSKNAARDIEFDGGNDEKDHSTDMQNSVISGCTFKKGGKWQVSFVEAKNVSITNNVFEGTGNIQSYQQPLHLEQLCENIIISGNQINSDYSSANYLIGGDNHGKLPGPKNIRIINNTFTGVARNGISASSSSNYLIENNDFSQATTSNRFINLDGSNNLVKCNEGVSASQVRLFGGTNNTFIPYSSSCNDGGTGDGLITLRNSGNNKYVSSENGLARMNCNRAAIGAWEKFTLEDAGDGKVALKGNNGKYVSSENGAQRMICNRTNLGAWEKFTLVDHGNKVYSLQGNNGKYVDVSMWCNQNNTGTNQRFKMINVGGARIDIETVLTKNGVEVFPNPASQILHVRINNLNTVPEVVEIYNMLGLLVLHQVIDSRKNFPIDISGLSQGIYTVRTNDYTERIIVK